MLSDEEKKEMRADGLNKNRREEFFSARKKKTNGLRRLDDYITFLTDVQKIKSFKHLSKVTSTEKNIL